MAKSNFGPECIFANSFFLHPRATGGNNECGSCFPTDSEARYDRIELVVRVYQESGNGKHYSTLYTTVYVEKKRGLTFFSKSAKNVGNWAKRENLYFMSG